jgi:hypothetical protein
MSLLLGNEVIVGNIKCSTINGLSAVGFTTNSAPSLTINAVQTVGNTIQISGSALNIPNGVSVNVYINTSDNFSLLTSYASFDAALLKSNGSSGFLTLSGFTLSASTAYYVFIYCTVNSTSTAISKSFAYTTPSTSKSITISSLSGFIGDTRVIFTGTCTNISTNITMSYSIGTNAVAAGSQTALTTVITPAQQQQFASGLPIDLTPLTLAAGNTYWLYLTDGTATAQLQFIPSNVTTVSVTNFNPQCVPTTTELNIQATTQNIDSQTGLIISYNTTGVSTSRTVVTNITAAQLNLGCTITFPVTFAYNTTYYIYVSDAINSTIYTSNSIVLGAAPVASVVITDLQTFIGSPTILLTPTFANLSVLTPLSLYVNTTNSNSGGTKIADITGRKLSGTQISVTNTYTFVAGTTYYFYCTMGSATSMTFTYQPIYATLGSPSIMYGQTLALPITTNATVTSILTPDTTVYIYVNKTVDVVANATLYGSDRLGRLNNAIITRATNAPSFNAFASYTVLNTYWIYLVYCPNGVTGAGQPIGSYQVLSKLSSTADLIPDNYPPLPITSTANTANASTSPSNKYGYGQYIVSSSSTILDPYNAFSQSGSLAWSAPGYNTYGAYTGSVSTTLANSQTVSGQWLQLAFPKLVYLYSVSIQIVAFEYSPSAIALLTSNDGTNWNLNSNLIGNLSYTTDSETRTLNIATKGGVPCKFARVVFQATAGRSRVAILEMSFNAIGSGGDSGDPNSKIGSSFSTDPLIYGNIPTFRLLSSAPPPKTMTITTSNVTNISALLQATNVNPNYANTDNVSIYNNPYDPNNLATPPVAITTVGTLKAGYLLNQFNAATVYNLVFVTAATLGVIPSFTTRNSPFTLTVTNVLSTSAKVTATAIDSQISSQDIVKFTNNTYATVYFTCTVLQLQSGFIFTGLTPSSVYPYYVVVYQGGSSVATYYTTCPSFSTTS